MGNLARNLTTVKRYVKGTHVIHPAILPTGKKIQPVIAVINPSTIIGWIVHSIRRLAIGDIKDNLRKLNKITGKVKIWAQSVSLKFSYIGHRKLPHASFRYWPVPFLFAVISPKVAKNARWKARFLI